MQLSRRQSIGPIAFALLAIGAAACSNSQESGPGASAVKDGGEPGFDAAASGGASGSTGGGSNRGSSGSGGGSASGGAGGASGDSGAGGGAGGDAGTGGGAGGAPGDSGAGGGGAAGDSGAGGGAGGDAGTDGASGQGGSGGGPNGDAGAPSRAACKRGVAYGNHSKADMAALSPASAWWYNWAHVPDEDLGDGSYRQQRVEYVPMVWGGSFDVDTVIDEIPADARTLLGFNEPNFGEQANLSATEAADLWPQVEQIADARGLYLVSPAVNFCGGDCQDTDPFGYLDDFFAACEGCRVDAVAFHIYVGCNQGGDNEAQWLIDHVETYKERFSQPLWLTEFACTDATGFADQVAFLEDAVAYLEAEPRIERYAWFSGRFDGIPYVDLLGADGELTPLGEAYVAAPHNPECPD